MAQLFPFNDPVAVERAPLKTIVAGDGAHVVDADGKRYLDAVAGLWCASLGFSDARLIAAAATQYETLPWYHSFLGRTAGPTVALGEKLSEKLPDGLAHVFFACSGSEAVDSAIKLVRYYWDARGAPGRRRIIARENAYHGSGFMGAALTGMSFCHDGFHPPLGDVIRAPRPHFYADAEPGESEADFARRRAEELEALIREAGPETIGAFIAEPVIGSGGVIMPPEGYWAQVQEVLRRYDILLIADEIITGFGRTGRWFGSETYGIRPDLMTMAKQLTASYFPMSGVALSDHVRDVIAAKAHDRGVLGHGFTYGGHPVGAAIALEAIAIYEEMDLPAHVGRLSARLRAGLEREIVGLDGVGDVRLVGLLGGVELRGDTKLGDGFGRAVGDAAEARGVFYRVIGNTLAISPPYIVGDAELDRIVETLRDSVREASERAF